MNRTPYETQATIRLHRQALLAEAARERLLSTQTQSRPLEQLLARAGRLLIDLGTRLETRYAASLLSADYSD